MLLRYSLAAPRAADDVERAVAAVLQAGRRTADLAVPGDAAIGCRAMGGLVRERLGGR
jgi:3-isopropylmalate dehydrogenase